MDEMMVVNLVYLRIQMMVVKRVIMAVMMAQRKDNKMQ